MKNKLLFLVALLTSTFTLFSQPIYNEDGIQLFHSPSAEEIEWVISKGLVSPPMAPTPPPVGQIRPIAEWEPAEAVLIRYPLGIPYSLIKEMAKDIKVITVVSSSNKQQAINNYTSNGVNMANCEFLTANTNTYWTRDYGPWFMAIDNNEVAMFDFNYNRIKFGHGGSPRVLDNAVNEALAGYLSDNGTQIDRYDSQLYLTGGNYMNDGIRIASSTTLIPTENPEYPLPQLKQQFQQYLGLEEYHFIPDPIYPNDAIQHIDCWSKLLAPDKVMLARVPQGSQNYNKFEAAKDSLEAIISSYGTPMQVFRVDEVAVNSSSTTPYTNSLILNNKVFVPITGHSYDAAAIQVYKDAMPGYEIIGIQYNNWISTDALHCRTHEIADRCMLYIKHQPLCGEIENTGSLIFSNQLYSYCNNPIIYDSVYVRIDGGEYVGHKMEFKDENSWEVTVFGLPNGVVEYYMVAKDESERRECHPYIGAPDPHKFILIGSSSPIPVLSLDKTNSSVTLDGVTVIEDQITISNLGNANLEFKTTDIEFPVKFTVTPAEGTIQPNGSQILTLSYDFNGVKNDEYIGSFKILSNDPQNDEVEISLCATIIVGINVTTNSTIHIYPNPANETIYINYNDASPTQAYIYNILGIRVKETILVKGINTIDIKNMPAGIYFIRIDASAYKVIKN